MYSYVLKRKIPLLNEEQWRPISTILTTRRLDSIMAYAKKTKCSLDEARKSEPLGQKALRLYHEISGQCLDHPDHLYAVQMSKYGRPCPECKKPFRTPRAKLCVECGFELPDGQTAGLIDVRSISHLIVNEALFSVFYKDDLIGHSRLEYGDPPMGVAQGRFIPLESFNNFRKSHVAIEDKDQRRWQGFNIITENGEELECNLETSIIEYGNPKDPLDIEVVCHAIMKPNYTKLFPHHVAAYEASF